jgi:hypothetical protein
LVREQEELARLSEVFEGTTPQGREILRRILYRAERLVQSKNLGISQAVDDIQNEFETFSILRPEFALQLSRLWGGPEELWLQASTRNIAILVVLTTRARLWIKRATPADA